MGIRLLPAFVSTVAVVLTCFNNSFAGDFIALTDGKFLTQRDARGADEAGDLFGFSLAAGDFNNDSYKDLAVGGPGEAPNQDPKSGAIFIFLGSSSGLAEGTYLTQRDARGANEAGDRFGHSLAAGDFDNDGFDDLVVGAPGEFPGRDPKSGAIFVFSGSASGLTNGSFLTQRAAQGANESGDSFGYSLAVGDFNNDGFDDLIVGAPEESPVSDPKSGAVFIFLGSSSGLSTGTFLTQRDTSGVNEAGDRFGHSLTAGDFDNDGFDDLVVGAPGEFPGPDPKSGAIFVFPGSSAGLAKGTFLTQREANGANEAGDRFGHSLTAGDFDNDGFDDLVVGAPGESPGRDPKSGAIFVFSGSSAGLAKGKFLTQTAVVDGSNDADDRFGWSLAVGDFNKDGFDDLGVGAFSKAPGSSFDPEPRSGVVFVFPGSVAGLSAATIRSQDRAGGSNEAGDVFGYSLAAGDFDNDDLDDLAVGAPGEAPNSAPKSGVIFFFLGSEDAAPSKQPDPYENYQLVSLDFSHSRIQDSGLSHLPELTRDLTYLNLDGTGITDAGLKHVQRLRKLKYLHVSDTQVTDAGLRQLKQALPNCRIFR